MGRLSAMGLKKLSITFLAKREIRKIRKISMICGI